MRHVLRTFLRRAHTLLPPTRLVITEQRLVCSGSDPWTRSTSVVKDSLNSTSWCESDDHAHRSYHLVNASVQRLGQWLYLDEGVETCRLDQAEGEPRRKSPRRAPRRNG